MNVTISFLATFLAEVREDGDGSEVGKPPRTVRDSGL